MSSSESNSRSVSSQVAKRILLSQATSIDVKDLQAFLEDARGAAAEAGRIIRDLKVYSGKSPELAQKLIESLTEAESLSSGIFSRSINTLHPKMVHTGVPIVDSITPEVSRMISSSRGKLNRISGLSLYSTRVKGMMEEIIKKGNVLNEAQGRYVSTLNFIREGKVDSLGEYLADLDNLKIEITRTSQEISSIYSKLGTELDVDDRIRRSTQAAAEGIGHDEGTLYRMGTSLWEAMGKFIRTGSARDLKSIVKGAKSYSSEVHGYLRSRGVRAGNHGGNGHIEKALINISKSVRVFEKSLSELGGSLNRFFINIAGSLFGPEARIAVYVIEFIVAVIVKLLTLREDIVSLNKDLAKIGGFEPISLTFDLENKPKSFVEDSFGKLRDYIKAGDPTLMLRGADFMKMLEAMSSVGSNLKDIADGVGRVSGPIDNGTPELRDALDDVATSANMFGVGMEDMATRVGRLRSEFGTGFGAIQETFAAVYQGSATAQVSASAFLSDVSDISEKFSFFSSNMAITSSLINSSINLDFNFYSKAKDSLDALLGLAESRDLDSMLKDRYMAGHLGMNKFKENLASYLVNEIDRANNDYLEAKKFKHANQELKYRRLQYLLGISRQAHNAIEEKSVQGDLELLTIAREFKVPYLTLFTEAARNIVSFDERVERGRDSNESGSYSLLRLFTKDAVDAQDDVSDTLSGLFLQINDKNNFVRKPSTSDILSTAVKSSGLNPEMASSFRNQKESLTKALGDPMASIDDIVDAFVTRFSSGINMFFSLLGEISSALSGRSSTDPLSSQIRISDLYSQYSAITEFTAQQESGGRYNAYQTSDTGGISYGKYQFTSRSKSLAKVLNTFASKTSDQGKKSSAIKYAQIIYGGSKPQLKSLESEASGFKAFLESISLDTAMVHAQEEVARSEYLEPIRDSLSRLGFDSLGIKFDKLSVGALSVLFDLKVNGGFDKIIRVIRSALRPQKSVTEESFIEMVLEHRRFYIDLLYQSLRRKGGNLNDKERGSMNSYFNEISRNGRINKLRDYYRQYRKVLLGKDSTNTNHSQDFYNVGTIPEALSKLATYAMKGKGSTRYFMGADLNTINPNLADNKRILRNRKAPAIVVKVPHQVTHQYGGIKEIVSKSYAEKGKNVFYSKVDYSPIGDLYTNISQIGSKALDDAVSTAIKTALDTSSIGENMPSDFNILEKTIVSNLSFDQESDLEGWWVNTIDTPINLE